jgi:hypothetical protein
MSTSTPDLFTSLRTGWVDAVQQWTDASQSLWDEMTAPFMGGSSAGPGSPWPAWGQQRSRPAHDHGAHHHDREHHHEHHDHGHHTGSDDCGCGTDRRGCGCSCGGGCGRGCGCGDHGHEHHDHHHDHDHDHDYGHDHHGSACGCRDACDCCVPDADVVVRTRVGERRIIPLALHNAWRRERPVTLAVGPWHVGTDTDLAVVAVLEEEQLTLAPCEDRIVRLVIGVTTTAGQGGDGGDGPGGGKGSDAAGPGEKEGSDVGLDTHVGMGQGRLPGDLDACACAYADVRFEGCSRPLRVAVVVSPSRCDPVQAGCDSGCC